MDKKPINTYIKNKTALERQRPNRNFHAEPIKDFNHVDEIISVFITGDLKSINSIVDSTEILNFKDKNNQTLIHAIIRNDTPNITEENKLEIIQKLIDNKNVSINAMTEYNQNPLHLACEKGLSLIIEYLIEKGCDQTLIDNYGNTPIHYLVDKFIRECGTGDFYSQPNKQIKMTNSNDLKKINNVLKKQSILILYKLLDLDTDLANYYCKEMGSNANKPINALKKFVSNKIQSSIQTIYELIGNKEKEITSIFIEQGINEEIKFERAKKIIYNIFNDVNQIYGLNLEFTDIVWDNFLTDQNFKIKDTKKTIKQSILERVEKIKFLLEENKSNLRTEIIDEIYIHLSGSMACMFYIYYFIKKFCNENDINVNGIDYPIIFGYFQKDGNIEALENGGNFLNLNIHNKDDLIKKFNSIIKKWFEDAKFKIFLNSVGKINNIEMINYFNNDFITEPKDNYKFYYNENYSGCIDLIDGQANVNGDMYYIFKIVGKIFNDKTSFDNFKNEKENSEIISLDENKIIEYLGEFKFTQSQFKYSPIRILVNLIEEMIKIIENKIDDLNTKDDSKFISQLQKFCLFDVKYLTEIIFKIINNIIILEKYLSDIDVDGIKNTIENFENIYKELIDPSKYGQEFVQIMEKFEYIKEKSKIKKNVINILLLKNYKEKLDGIYDKCTDVLDEFVSMIEMANQYFSNEQLEKYNELLTNYINKTNNQIKISNTIYNNYYYEIKYPSKYKLYKENFFKIKDNINLYDEGQNFKNLKKTGDIIDLDTFIFNPNYKKDFIEKILPYENTFNFNQFYLNKTNFTINYTDLKKEKKKFKLEKTKYPIKNFEFKSGEYKFSRGYDILHSDCSGSSINPNNILNIDKKEEIKILCDMDAIKNWSDYDANSGVKENSEIIVSWSIEDNFEMDPQNIDKFEQPIITNNLNMLINALVFVIYEKIKNPLISNAFFEQNKIIFVNNNDGTEKEFEIGINLNDYGLDLSSINNMQKTLEIIQLNAESRKEYLYDNIKSFVKIILYEEISSQTFKIMDEIKIEKKEGKQNIINSDESLVDKFNKNLKTIDFSYKNNFATMFAQYISEINSSSSLDLATLLNTDNANITELNDFENKTDKIIGNKCLDIPKINKLMLIPGINFRVLDTNGNSMLIRLIEQFNIYGIKKILDSRRVIATYKNNNMETPIDYIKNALKNIQNEYSNSNFSNRIQRYSIVLENAIKTSGLFDGIELTNSENLVIQIITNSIYLLNETLWLQVYSYPLGWDIENKKNLKKMLGFKNDENDGSDGSEILLINSFDVEDGKKYSNNIKSSVETKITSYAKVLEKQIEAEKNKAKELEIEIGSDNSFIKQSDAKLKEQIQKIRNRIKELETQIDKFNKLNTTMGTSLSSSSGLTSGSKISDKIGKYKDKLLDIENLSIKWDEYKKLLDELDDDYLKIISILNAKCTNTSSISNYLIKIYNKNITNENTNELIGKYFKLIYEPIFNNYWDLDRYDDTEYNSTHSSILWILKLNVVNIIKNELINSLSNYIIQINRTNEKTQDIIEKFKNDDSLKSTIELYLYNSLIKKLELNNPDKENLQISLDELETNIINGINKKLGSQIDKEEQDEIKKIIGFNKFVCENIGFNCYEEITKILTDGKKISLYYEIYGLINKAINLSE